MEESILAEMRHDYGNILQNKYLKMLWKLPATYAILSQD